MLDGWDTVRVAGVSSDTGSAELGTDRTVTVDVDLGALTTDDVDVQLLHGPAGAGDELIDPEVVSLAWSGTTASAAAWSATRAASGASGRAATGSRCGWYRATPA